VLETLALCCCLARYSIVIHFFPGNAVLQLHTNVYLFYTLILQHCCYGVVCHVVRSLMAFVCQEIKGLLTYLLTNPASYPAWPDMHFQLMKQRPNFGRGPAVRACLGV